MEYLFILAFQITCLSNESHYSIKAQRKRDLVIIHPDVYFPKAQRGVKLGEPFLWQVIE